MDFKEDFFVKLGRSPAVVNLVTEATERVADVIRGSAPVDSGEYKDGIQTRIKYQKRVVGLVEGTDPKTLLIESKTGNMARGLKTAARNRG